MLISATFAGALGAALPLMFLNFKATRTRKKMQEQFPVALDVFVRGLRAGHPIAAALDLLTTEMPDPIGSQFGLAVDEVTYGAELRDALQSMAERWDLDDMRMFVVSLSVQNETGGNLAEILENLSKVIRERQSMMMKVRALSSEGRMTAIMLTVLPIFTFTLLFLLNPAFFLDVAGDPWFVPGFIVLDHHVFHRIFHDPEDGRFEGMMRCSNSSPKMPCCSMLLLVLLFAVVAARPVRRCAGHRLPPGHAPPLARGRPEGRRRNARRWGRCAPNASKARGSSWSTRSRSAASAWSTPRTRRCARS